MLVAEEQLSPALLTESLTTLYRDRQHYIDAMSKSTQKNGVEVILGLIDEITLPGRFGEAPTPGTSQEHPGR